MKLAAKKAKKDEDKGLASLNCILLQSNAIFILHYFIHLSSALKPLSEVRRIFLFQHVKLSLNLYCATLNFVFVFVFVVFCLEDDDNEKGDNEDDTEEEEDNEEEISEVEPHFVIGGK